MGAGAPTAIQKEEGLAQELEASKLQGAAPSGDAPHERKDSEDAGANPAAGGLAARRSIEGLKVEAMKNVDSIGQRAKCCIKVGKIEELYRLGKEVMPSSNPGMEVLFATRVSDGADVVIKTRRKKDSFVTKEEERVWLKSTTMLLNLPQTENIAQIHDLIDDGKTYYIVMEKAEGIDLFEVLHRDKQLAMETVKDVLRQLLQGLQALHAKGCVHRDIKLENVVVDAPETPRSAEPMSPVLASTSRSGHMNVPKMRPRRPSTCSISSVSSITSQASVKLIDFDTLEKYSPIVKAKEVVGTDQYIAPEAYLGHYSPASDIFAVGVIGYRLVTGRFPFKSSMFDDQPGENWVGSPQMKKIADRLEKYEVNFKIDPWPREKEACELIKWMLKSYESERPTAQQALDHPFLEDSFEEGDEEL